MLYAVNGCNTYSLTYITVYEWIKLLYHLRFLFARFLGSRAILSGPAGGVVGYALTTYQKQSDNPVIGFDMGGRTSSVV